MFGRVWASERQRLEAFGGGRARATVSEQMSALHALVKGVAEPSERLRQLLAVRDVLEPLHFVAKKKLIIAQEAQKAKCRVGVLQGLARRLAPYAKPPPEYSDWSGLDTFCVPGYMFPCPDNAMLMRALFYQGGAAEATLRCLPPAIEAELQPDALTLFKLVLRPAAPQAKCFVSVQFEPFKPYDPVHPPTLTAPGEFSVQAYSTAPNYLPSELTIKVLKLQPAEAAAHQPEVARGTSVFENLLWNEGDDETDDDE